MVRTVLLRRSEDTFTWLLRKNNNQSDAWSGVALVETGVQGIIVLDRAQLCILL